MNSIAYNYDDADRDDGREKEECPKCKGEGKVFDWFFFYDKIRCPECDGEGVI